MFITVNVLWLRGEPTQYIVNVNYIKHIVALKGEFDGNDERTKAKSFMRIDGDEDLQCLETPAEIMAMIGNM